MSLTVRRPRHAFIPPQPMAAVVPAVPSPKLVAAEAEIQRLREQLGRCEVAYEGWRRRALENELVLEHLPAELSPPYALIRRAYTERDMALHVAHRYRLAWTSARRRALPPVAEAAAEPDVGHCPKHLCFPCGHCAHDLCQDCSRCCTCQCRDFATT